MRCYVLLSDNLVYAKHHTVANDHEQNNPFIVPVPLKEFHTYADLRIMQIQMRMSES